MLQPTQCLNFSSTENPSLLKSNTRASAICHLFTDTDDTADPLSLDASKRVDELGPKAVVIDVEIVM